MRILICVTFCLYLSSLQLNGVWNLCSDQVSIMSWYTDDSIIDCYHALQGNLGTMHMWDVHSVHH